jgi:hypothetical protein
LKTVFGPPTPVVVTAGNNINWNQDNPADTTDTGLSRDINNFGISGCGASTTPVTLNGFLDWDPSFLKLIAFGSSFNSNGTANDNRPPPETHVVGVDTNFPTTTLVQYSASSIGNATRPPLDDGGILIDRSDRCPSNTEFDCKDGMQGNLHWMEIDMKDVTKMRDDRIAQLVSNLDLIPGDEFLEYEKSIETYKETFGTNSLDKAVVVANKQVRETYNNK